MGLLPKTRHPGQFPSPYLSGSRGALQGVRACFGAFAESVAAGLALRHDHGSQYVADDFQRELAFLGIEPSPAFVREPEGNGCAERFIRTLKENLLWVRRFATVEDLRQALHVFQDTYNRTWIVERHGSRPGSWCRSCG
jgi:putative transposase